MVYSKTFYFETEEQADRLEPQIVDFISKNGLLGYQEVEESEE